ncbi:MAG: hypothetical protein IJS15_09050, partial [Victivallales bacterium]|nr:hypothetical protein [Victivallales bacterium]
MPSCVIRQAALGDFILTIPLLKALASKGPLNLVCPKKHYELIAQDIRISRWLDSASPDAASLYSDSLNASMRSLLEGSEIHCFQRLDLPGAIYHNPKPMSPPSAARRFMDEAGFGCSDNFEQTPPLPRSSSSGDFLWIHAGSGSASKNVPPDYWIDALRRSPRRRTILSFGECELGLESLWRKAFMDAGIEFECVVNPPLPELRRLLEGRAAEYWGVDTGVTHLA